MIGAFQLLRLDRWFIPGIISVLLMSASGVGMFLKMWTTTPSHIEPAIKISLFDRLQAASLASSAHVLEEKGNYADAKASWTLAVANDPGNLNLIRGTLRVLGKESATHQTGREAAIYGSWLLRLTQTNRSDLSLVIKTLEHTRRYQEIGQLLEGEQPQLTAETQAVRLRALFHFGQYRQFQKVWERSPDLFGENKRLQLYYLGLTAILNQNPEDFRALKDAYNALDPYDPHYLESRQIAIRAHAAGQHTGTCHRLLKELVDRRMATLPDHLFYWHLLIRNGLGELILNDLEDVGQPATESEAVNLARTLHLAGHKSESAAAAQNALKVFGASAPDLWLQFGNQLAVDQEWHQLNTLAQEVHRHEAVSDRIGPMAQYWEALTALQSDHPDKAAALFQTIVQSPPRSPQMRFALATRLLSLGQDEAADALVEGLDGKTNEVRTYWGVRIGAAIQAKDSALFLSVAKAAYNSSPEFAPHINNYLSALLGERQRTNLVMELSKKLMASNPDQIAFRLNRAHALCLNADWDQAVAILDKIEPNERTAPAIKADYQLARFRLAAGQGNRERMSELHKSMDLSHFMPVTEEWIRESIKTPHSGILAPRESHP